MVLTNMGDTIKCTKSGIMPILTVEIKICTLILLAARINCDGLIFNPDVQNITMVPICLTYLSGFIGPPVRPIDGDIYASTIAVTMQIMNQLEDQNA